MKLQLIILLNPIRGLSKVRFRYACTRVDIINARKSSHRGESITALRVIINFVAFCSLFSLSFLFGGHYEAPILGRTLARVGTFLTVRALTCPEKLPPVPQAIPLVSIIHFSIGRYCISSSHDGRICRVEAGKLGIPRRTRLPKGADKLPHDLCPIYYYRVYLRPFENICEGIMTTQRISQCMHIFLFRAQRVRYR